MKRKNKTVRKGNFIARLQRRPKIKSIRSKIKKAKAVSKRLSKQYKSLLKSESRKVR